MAGRTFRYKWRAVIRIDYEHAPEDSRLVPAAEENSKRAARRGHVEASWGEGGGGRGALHLLREGGAEGCCDMTDEGGEGGLRHEDDKMKRGAGAGNKMRERRGGGNILEPLSSALHCDVGAGGGGGGGDGL